MHGVRGQPKPFAQTYRPPFERRARVLEEVVSPSSRATVTSTFVSEAVANLLAIASRSICRIVSARCTDGRADMREPWGAA